MAKRKVSGKSRNKSAAIRDYKSKNPKAKPREIAKELNRRGVKVSAQYVSTILSTARRQEGETRRRGRPSNVAINSRHLSVEDLILVKKLIAKTGSIKAAKRAVDVYAELIA